MNLAKKLYGKRSFKRPQDSTDSEMLDNGILVRYKGEQIVGVTVLDASKR
jgi:hypothetical protein